MKNFRTGFCLLFLFGIYLDLVLGQKVPVIINLSAENAVEEVNVTKGDDVHIVCVTPVALIDTLRTAWFKDEKKIDRNGDHDRLIINRIEIVIKRIKPLDRGYYECRVMDEVKNDIDSRKGVHINVFKRVDTIPPDSDLDYPIDKEDAEDAAKSCDNVMSVEGFKETDLYNCLDLKAHKRRMTHYLVKSAGTSVTLHCNPKGNPTPKAKWYKKINDTRFPFNPIGVDHKQVNNSLVFKALTANDEAFYICESSNSNSTIEYDVQLLVQHRYQSIPVITEFYNVTTLVGQKIQLICVVEGEVHTLGVSIETPKSSRTDNLTISNNRHILLLENVTTDDAGWYTCYASNSLGRADRSAYVDVLFELDAIPVTEKAKDAQLTILLMCGILAALIVGVVFIAAKYKYNTWLVSIDKKHRPNGWTKQVIIERRTFENNDEGAILIPEVNIKNIEAQIKGQEYVLPTDVNWEFSRDKLLLGKHLGEGAFGEVREGAADGISERGLVSTVAVKSLKKTHTDTEMIDLISEMETMKELGRHVNIINLLGCCTQGGELLVIMEFAEHGNLRDFLRDNRHQFMYERPKQNPINTVIPVDVVVNGKETLAFKDLMSFAYQVARGMDYLVQRKYVHRDLAARNVLVATNMVVKIADFGMTRSTFISDYYRKRSDGRVPVKWMAPETLFHRIYTTQSDVWSYGVLLWEIVTLGGTPYPSMPDVNKLLEFLKTGKRMTQPPNCPTELYLIMRDCWVDIPTGRPKFANLVQDIGRIMHIASGTEYLELEGMRPIEEQEVVTPPSSPENSASGLIMFDPEFVRSFSEP